eukprot:gnl/TRDRNA2_/TRDRNA2_88459_c0_seq1.p1 gnl/TRDRNA2_/TRDRNA2_88459_c0~~gnl/TRDRNA2_/TRDRNA2_88459_c0_seq1.p1  ORF type:complete len:256 (+),score=50.20 gnl/TRDRNA2_/TRDRNA2_88459_c0_seq1:1-768(+)
MLTQEIGHQAYLWGADEDLIREWFGSIEKSMQTLFTIMTLSEWVGIERTLSKVVPNLLVLSFLVCYIFITSYAMMSLITGVISESLISAQSQERDFKLREMIEQQEMVLSELQRVLDTVDEDGSGIIERKEVESALYSHPEILEQLSAIDLQCTSQELLHLFDRLMSYRRRHADHEHEGLPTDEFMEAIRNLSGDAKAPAVFEVKHLVLSLELRLEESEQNADQRASHLQQEVDELKTSMKGIHDKLDILLADKR